MFAFTIFASTVSRRGNKCAKVYDTDLDWAKVHPKASRRQEYETLSFLFAKDDIIQLVHVTMPRK